MIAKGGEMNTFAGQRGFYCHSVKPLIRMGLIERVPECAACAGIADDRSIFDADHVCIRPLPAGT
ncbi:MAG: hypothetical protein PHQ28_14075, partial [Mycobacterium sp.]|nr:hypothetical protein [Mycobacterium sp.]